MEVQSKKNEKQLSKEQLFKECFKKAEGNKIRAQAIFNHISSKQEHSSQKDLDKRKMANANPLLVLYTLGTIGVLALVFGYLGTKLNWW